MSRSIRFNIAADVDMSDLHKLTSELKDMQKDLNKLDNKRIDIIDPQSVSELRKASKEMGELTKHHTRIQAKNVRTTQQLEEFGNQARAAFGRGGRAALDFGRDIGTLTTKFRNITKDISNVDRIAKNMELWPDKQRKAIDESAKALDRYTKAQERLHELRRAGKADSSEFKKVENELKAASREMDKAAAKIDKLDSEYTEMNATLANTQNRFKELKAATQSTAYGKEFEKMIPKVDALEDALKSSERVAASFGKEMTNQQASMLKYRKTLRDSGKDSKDLAQETRELSNELQKMLRLTTRDVGAQGQLSAATRAITTQRQEYSKLTTTIQRTTDATELLTNAERAISDMMKRGTASALEQIRMTSRLREAREELNTSQKTLRSQDSRLYAQMVEYRVAIDRASASLRALGSLGANMTRGSSEWQANRVEMEKAASTIIELRTAMSSLGTNQSQVKTALRQTGTELNRLDEITATYNQSLKEIKAMRSVWEQMLAPIRNVTNVAKRLADMFGKTVTTAINVAVRAMRGISQTAGSVFSGLQRALQSSGNAFNRFGSMVQNSMNRARDSMLAVTAAGYALMSIGSQVQMFGNMAFRRMGSVLDGYADYERSRIQAAIAATEFDTASGTMNVDNALLDRIIFSMQSGRPGVNSYGQEVSYVPQWMTDYNQGKTIPVTFDSKELAQGMYYYSAAIGQPITADNAQLLMPTISTIMQMARVTNTELESAIKGVMNIAMEFGYNPRGLTQQDQLDMQTITAQVGYLANISTMEVQDIVEMFKMVGPLANQVAGGTKGAGLTDTMLLAFMASEVGLRGGNVGRGVQQLFTSLIDPTNKMLGVMGKYFNEGGEPFTAEAYRERFFEDGALRNYGDDPRQQGILGFFSQLADKGLKGADMATMVAEMFTNNATRAAIGPILGLSKDEIAGMKWDEFFEGWDENPLKWLAQAAAETADSVSGWMDYMKNAWFQFTAAIINSVKGPLTGAFRVIGELLFELASFITDVPAVGKILAGVVSVVGALASIGGTAIIASGALMILSRTILTLGGGLSMFVRFIMMGALSLGVIIPAVLALALAVSVLSKLWQKDVLGMRTRWEEFTSSMSGKDVGMMFDGLGRGITKAGYVFDNFVEGVLFGNKQALDNFAAWLHDLLGPKFTSVIIGNLEKINPRLKSFEDRLAGLSPAYKSGIADLNDYTTAFRGFWEQVVFGSMSTDAMVSISKIGSAFGLAPGELRKGFNDAAESLRNFIAYVANAAKVIVGMWKDIGDQIYNNLARAFDISSFSDFFDRLRAFTEGVVIGFATAISLVLRAIERLTAGIAALATRFRSAGVDTERLSNGFRMLGIAIGLALGARFALAFAPLMGVIRFLIPAILSLTGLFVGLAGRILTTALNVGILIVQMTLLAAKTILVAGLTAAFNLLQWSLTAVTGVTALATLGFQGLITTAFGILGLAAVIGGIVYIIIGLTQGFAQANQAARAFIGGVLDGFMPFLRIITSIIAVVLSMINLFLDLIGVTDKLGTSARTLGVILGAVFGALLLKAIAGVLLSLGGLVMAFGGLPLAAGLAIFAVVAVFNEWTGALDPIISKLGEVVGLLNKVEVGGVGLGDALVTAGIIAASSKTGRSGMGKVAKAAFKYVAVPTAKLIASHPVAAAVLAGTVGVGYSLYRDLKSPYVWDGQGIPEHQKESMYDSHIVYSRNMSDYTRSDEFEALPLEQRRNAVLAEQYRQVQAGNIGGFRWDESNPDAINSVNPIIWDVIEAEENVATARNRMNSIFGIPSGTSSRDSSIPSGATRTKREPNKKQGEAGAMQYVDGFVGWLKSSGHYDLVDGIAGSLGFDLDNLSFSDFTDLYSNLTKMPNMDKLFSEYDMLEYMPNGKEYKKAIDEYTKFNNLVEDLMRTHGYTQAEAISEAKRLYGEWGVEIPVDPGTYDEFNAQQEAFLRDAEDAAAKFEEISQRWSEAALGWAEMSTPELFSALYDPLAGKDNKSLVSWISGEGWDAISQNLPEGSAPWMNQTEFMADFALGGGMQFAGEGIYGQNLHTLLKNSGALDALSAQAGVPVEVLLEGVPKFTAPEKFQAAAMNDMVNMIDGLRDVEGVDVATWFDTVFGTDFMTTSGEYATQFGGDWAELNNFAIGKALSNQDWNLVDYISESWDISRQEAQDYLDTHGIDADSISSSWYETTKDAILSNQGAYSVLTTEMYEWLHDATSGFTSDVIHMTESEFLAMDDATKAILTRMGYTFVLNDYVPPEALAKAREDVKALRKTLEDVITEAEGTEGGTWNFKGPDLNMDGMIEDWAVVGRHFDEEKQKWMVIVEDINGTQMSLPEVEYEAYMNSLEVAKRGTIAWVEGFRTHVQDSIRNNPLDPLGMMRDIAGYSGQDAGGYGNATLGVPPEIKTKVTLEVAEIPDVDLSAALGVPMTDGAGTIKLNLETEGFSEAQEIAQSIQKDLEAIATTPVNVKINIDTVGMPATSVPDVAGPPAPGTAGPPAPTGAGISIPVTADLAPFNTAIGELTTRLSTAENPMQLKIGADLSQANQEIGELVSRLALSENPVKIKIGADLTSAVTDVSTFTTALNTTESTINVKLKGDLTVDNKISYMIDRLEELAITWTATISQTGADAAATSIGNVTEVARNMATPWIATVTVLGTATASQMIQNVINLATDVAKTWFVSVSVLVYGAQSITNLKNALDGLPTTKNVTVNTYRNEYVSRVGNNSGQGWTAAVGGRVGSSAFSNRTAFKLGQNDRYTGQYAALANQAASLPSGLTLVGEAGPELVGLPSGSYVMNAHQTASLFREGQQGSGNPLLLAAGQSSQGDTTVNNEQNLTLNFNGDMHFGSEASAREFFEQIDRRSGREFDLAKRGMRPVSERIT